VCSEKIYVLILFSTEFVKSNKNKDLLLYNM